MRVEYHPLTASDLNNAVAFYNQQRAGLGDEFRSEVYAVFARILSNPLQSAIFGHSMRRAFVHRFPYSILFRVIGEEVVRVLVIRHHRRHSAFGTSRR